MSEFRIQGIERDIEKIFDKLDRHSCDINNINVKLTEGSGEFVKKHDCHVITKDTADRIGVLITQHAILKTELALKSGLWGSLAAIATAIVAILIRGGIK